MRARDFDLVLFGASGFTGRLVAEVLHAWRSGGGALRWALAGRDPARLAAVRDALGAGEALPLLWADARDAAALARLAARTRAILSTVGPYQLHGEPLVTACAHAGTDYVDLCGEPLWMARMIRQLQAPAQSSGARIVFSCGFDSIPFDLGVVFLQHAARERLGAPLAEVHATVRAMKGGFSGGTAAS
ncbi:MAG: saccharopine dehydrogenase NADP-binding domain-containing protein, partial [Rhodoferax sp.]|nr:saccharopine dehydrogenase NADP-binding domain-containing protein [Rhodoferax sp.]